MESYFYIVLLLFFHVCRPVKLMACFMFPLAKAYYISQAFSKSIILRSQAGQHAGSFS